MNLTELKMKSVPELVELSQTLGLEAPGRVSKQELIFKI